MSNMQVVDRAFIDEFVPTFELRHAKDKEEFDTFVQFSATMRRVFSRWKRKIPLIGRDGSYNVVIPSTGEVKPARVESYLKIGPFKTEAAYRRAVLAAKGVVPAEGLQPA